MSTELFWVVAVYFVDWCAYASVYFILLLANIYTSMLLLVFIFHHVTVISINGVGLILSIVFPAPFKE